MSQRIGRLGLLGVLLAAACYNPDLTAVRYACDETNPYCPEGLDCVGGVCQDPAAEAMTMAQPPPSTDGGVSSGGCRYTAGTDLGGGVYACPGLFNNKTDAIPTASQLCADNYSVCKTPGSADLAKCKTLNGFFAANVPATRNGFSVDANAISCSPAQNNQFPAWAGCGRTAKNEIVDKNCNGFSQVLDCYAVRTWSCYSTSIDNLENTNANDGVLCCRN